MHSNTQKLWSDIVLKGIFINAFKIIKYKNKINHKNSNKNNCKRKNAFSNVFSYGLSLLYFLLCLFFVPVFLVQIFLFTFLSIIPTPIFAQIPAPKGYLPLSFDKKITQYVCEVWQKDKGLPQNSVFAIRQSHDGYLWIATYEGLARFDGIEFDIYNTTNTPALRTSGIWEIFQDKKNRIWFGTNNGGLTCLENGKFKTYTTDDGLPSNTITKMTEDKEGFLWIGTKNGLCKWKLGENIKNYTTADGLASKEITALYTAKDGSIWIGSTRGLNVYQNGTFEDYGRNKILLFNRTITSIAEDLQGNFWLGSQAGLIKWIPSTKKYRYFQEKDSIRDENITKLFCDKQGAMWIGTQSAGVARFLPKNEFNPTKDTSETPKFEFFDKKNGLSANSVTEIYEDHEGSLWIGLNRGGMNRLKDGKFTNFGVSEGLSDNVVNCVYESSDGAIWAGTTSGGITRYKKGVFQQITTKEGLSSNYIRSIMEGENGDIWVAMYGAGINQITFDKNFGNIKVKHYTVNEGLAGNVARSLTRRKKGGFYIGTRTGLSIFDKGIFTNITTKQGLSDNSVTVLHEDKLGRLWIGTDGGGINCLLPDNRIKIYDMKAGLANNLIFSFFEDEKGAMWVGTKGGLSHIKEGKITNIYAKDGLPHDAVHSITPDALGRLWFSCNTGVFFLEKKQLEQFIAGKIKKIAGTLYQEEDGMKSSDCAGSTQPSAIVDKQGKIWFPTTSGLAMINPKQIFINPQKPHVKIKKMIVDNEEQDLNHDINLKAGKTRFEIDFTALSFIAPNKVQFRYKLEGDHYKENWIIVSKREQVFYTNLPPGNYTFKVQACNNDGIWNEEGTILHFYLAPYFYQTYIFWLFVVVIIVALLVVGYRWRVSALEKSQKILEDKILQSTEKIRNQYEEIQQQKEELQIIESTVRIINKETALTAILPILLQQALHLFPKADKGIFLMSFLEKVRSETILKFEIKCTEGYKIEDFSNTIFHIKQVFDYCEMGEKLTDDFYYLNHIMPLQALTPEYLPKTSLVMYIPIRENIEAVLLLDCNQNIEKISLQDIESLLHFKEHAVSAFGKAKSLQEIETTNLQLERSFKKISDSIKYARKIQNAILVDKKELEDEFEDFFVLYQPRDMVSGDFYWFAETSPEPVFAFENTQENEKKTSIFKGFSDIKKVLAVMDCTGHGVPGAFMTVIGNDILNSIVLEEHIYKPDRILAKLDKSIRNYLKQDEPGQTQDGMDMAVMVFDNITQKIELAGAKNPILMIRNGELTEFKGSKHPIGGVQIPNKKFETTIIEYEKNDIFYLFSDGYQDQFGKKEGMTREAKFGRNNFYKLLLEISPLPMREQKRILMDTLVDWMNGKEQIDDIIVLGIKM